MELWIWLGVLVLFISLYGKVREAERIFPTKPRVDPLVARHRRRKKRNSKPKLDSEGYVLTAKGTRDKRYRSAWGRPVPPSTAAPSAAAPVPKPRRSQNAASQRAMANRLAHAAWGRKTWRGNMWSR